VHVRGLETLAPVVLYLGSPKEKIWGLLLELSPAGILLRGLDVDVFEDWLRQESRADERMIMPAMVFYPMHRVERLERDESLGPIMGLAERFLEETGRSVQDALATAPE